MLNNNSEYIKGRGAQGNINNRFNKLKYSLEHIEGLDESFLSENIKTEFIVEYPKTIISRNKSQDLSFGNSINPYLGCEHGCIYCYARNSHEYWGFDPALDFERKIIIKPKAAELLREEFNKKNYVPGPILLSGNTDCYQPAERKFKITRSLLEVFLEFKHPVSIITKNSLILRDIDLLSKLRKNNLVSVSISITSLNESLRNLLEPRTVTAKGRLKIVKELSDAGIPVNVMVAPIIPGLNSEEIPKIIEAAAINGAVNSYFTIVRLNGAISDIFKDWLYKNFPDRAEKTINRISACHNGKLNDSRWMHRLTGNGVEAEAIHQLFKISMKKSGLPKNRVSLDYTLFTNNHNKQLTLF
ncbi:PA0069 family radical SAM protein [Pseudopedobacter beijingensis]|uniref:PA0069 family radical SAM protein n=1 Tax=Pseudopedobacter beijingensis TaxID=1207056 RepID=A0ABW4IDL1_9SPHI